MKAVLWYIIYVAIGIGTWVFFKVTTRDEREWLIWHGVVILFVPAAIVFVFTELLPALLR